MPERAMACCFNLEYLLVGGHDGRTDDRPVFMWYDWMAGGWGGRNGKDGTNATSPVFGVGLAVQPLEGQERLTPVRTTVHRIAPDSGGPGRFRGGCGVEKGGTLTQAQDAVMSLLLRPRAVDHVGHRGRPAVAAARRVAHAAGWRASASWGRRSPTSTSARATSSRARPRVGAGFGDPLERDPEAVLEDVADGYVTVRRAALDYGVVVNRGRRRAGRVRAPHRGDRPGARAHPRRARGLARGGRRGGRRALPLG